MKQEYKNTTQTKSKIARAYLTLVSTQGDNFSVTDLVKYAGVNRGTFYLHFKSKEDVSNYIVDTLSKNFNGMENAFRLYDISQNPELILGELNKILLKDINYYKLVISANASNNFVEHIKNTVLKLISNNFKIMQYVFSIEKFNIAVRYIVGGGIDAYLHWLKGDVNCELEEMSNFLCQLIKNGLKGVLRYDG